MAKNEEGVCQYCKCRKKLCNAHIIPESFYVGKGLGPFLQIQADDFIKRRPIGYYDQNIICRDCDGFFSAVEGYVSKLFDDTVLQNYKTGVLYILNKPVFDYSKVRRFILFLLWKAGVSLSSGCSCVRLGKYEDILLDILKGVRPDDDELFKIFIVKFKEKEMQGAFAIKKTSFGGNIAYAFICNGFVFYVIPRLGFNVKNEPYSASLLTSDRMIITEVDTNFDGIHKMFREMMLKQINFINSKKGSVKDDK